MRQSAFGFIKDYKKEFGGALLDGKRKSRRPLSTKHPVHLVLKANQRFFNPTNQGLQKLIRNTAGKFGIKIYNLALVWNHIHLQIKIKDRKNYVQFIRALSSLIAQVVIKTKRLKEKLFTLRPYTRVLSWGRDLRNVFDYIIQNQMEAWGLTKRKRDKMDRKIQHKKKQGIAKRLKGWL